MFLIKSEEELQKAFRPRDRKVFDLPEKVTFPLVVRDYYAWVDPSGYRVYLLTQDSASGRPMGITFRREPNPPKGGSHMCDWCHAYGSSMDIGLLMADRNSKKALGVWLCRDLSCVEKIQQAADLAGKSPAEPKRRLYEKMQRFAHEGLGIEEVPA